MSSEYGFANLDSDGEDGESAQGCSAGGLQVPQSVGFALTPASYHSPSNLLEAKAPWAKAATRGGAARSPA